jgi:hypothetical protein
MGNDGPSLPVKALMYLELVSNILNLVDGIDSNDPTHRMLIQKVEMALDKAFVEIELYKEEL